jgi:hypothetical protein
MPSSDRCQLQTVLAPNLVQLVLPSLPEMTVPTMRRVLLKHLATVVLPAPTLLKF